MRAKIKNKVDQIKSLIGAGEMVYPLRVYIAFTENQGSASTATLVSSQLPRTPAPGVPTSSSGLSGYCHSCADTQTQTHLYTCNGNDSVEASLGEWRTEFQSLKKR